MVTSVQEMQWVLRARTSDREALEALLRSVQPSLRRYLSGIAGATDADDLLQDVLVIVVRKLGDLEDPALFRAWTFRIASREAFRHIKKRRLWQGRYEDDSRLEAMPMAELPPSGEALRELLAAKSISPASGAVLMLNGVQETTMLGGAAFHGHWQLCQFLIERGADASHAAANTGETPLHAALCKANRPIYEHVVRILLKQGADPNRATIPGVETGDFMRDIRTRGETPLHRAAAFGTETAVQLLLDAGATREARDVNGDTPLTWASWHLRPAPILRKLCYGSFGIHPQSHSTYDHGMGWGQMDPPNMGRPHLAK